MRRRRIGTHTWIKDDRVPASQLSAPVTQRGPVEPSAAWRVLVACPDARPPAYEAVAGLAQSGLLGTFFTAFYYGGTGRITALARLWAPCRYRRWRRVLKRRHHPRIPADHVRSDCGFDVAATVEARLGRRLPAARRALARLRTRRFDRILARVIRRERPEVAFVFSDVASEFALPACREVGALPILSMVHGDVREEQALIAAEAERSPDFFPIYLADGPIDRDELAWLQERRLRDIELAERILVPSEHIAQTLARYGIPSGRIHVVPYAADTVRFRPPADKRHCDACTFLFAGGITQRKGIKYLLEAWRLVRRPGWRLQLLGGLPADPAPLGPYQDEVEWLGRVGHADVPARMAAADVFVFPSLFEGSAVVTYEALACGLPSVVTPSAGSVVRDGIDGFLVPPADVEALAERLERLGCDAELRAAFAADARRRALEFDWPRYHEAVVRLAAGGLGER
jgi:glycosyltransferase involved in cell wall biosynthesis